jgi:L-arabinokinase
MWRFEHPPKIELPDTERFLASLQSHAEFFDTTQPVMVARAPGRLDLMGGISDYSGSLVLELPLACAAWVAAQWETATTREATVTAFSANADDVHGAAQVAAPLAELLGADYEGVRHRLRPSSALVNFSRAGSQSAPHRL